MTATTLHIGYLGSGFMFLGLILIPFLAHRYLGMNEVLAFWMAYVLTRPLGASFADWMAVETSRGGLGPGAGGASLILIAVVLLCIRRLATTKIDVLVEDVDLEAEGSGGDRLSGREALGLDLRESLRERVEVLGGAAHRALADQHDQVGFGQLGDVVIRVAERDLQLLAELRG